MVRIKMLEIRRNQLIIIIIVILVMKEIADFRSLRRGFFLFLQCACAVQWKRVKKRIIIITVG